MVYLAFLGLVVLLLVSVFVAQANGSYNSVQSIADQMANYSSARLLTQTSTMLPIWLCCLFMVNILLINTLCVVYVVFNFDDYIVSLHFIIIYLSTANRESAHNVKFYLMYGHIGHATATVAMEHAAFCELFGK